MWGTLHLIKFWLAPCCECCILSFGWFPSVSIFCANVLQHSVYSIYEDGTDRVFRKVGSGNSDARELLKRKNTTKFWLFVCLLFNHLFCLCPLLRMVNKWKCPLLLRWIYSNPKLLKWSNFSNSNNLLLRKSAGLCWFWGEKCSYSERRFLYLWTVASWSAEPALSARGTSRNCGNLILFYSVGNMTIV